MSDTLGSIEELFTLNYSCEIGVAQLWHQAVIIAAVLESNSILLPSGEIKD